MMITLALLLIVLAPVPGGARSSLLRVQTPQQKGEAAAKKATHLDRRSLFDEDFQA
jgi:hypothetical protein